MPLAVPGFYSSVVWTPQGWRILAGGYPDTSLLLVYDEAGSVWAQARLTTLPHFLKGAASPSGLIAWCAQDDHDRFRYGFVRPDGTITDQSTTIPAFGQSGVNVAWIDGDFTFYCLTSGTTYVTIRAGVVSAPIATPLPTSQGWIDVFGGNLRWIDLYRDDPVTHLRFETTQGAVTFGQDLSSPADRLVGIGPDGRFLVADVLGMEPTIAMSPDGSEWRMCWRQLHGQIGIGHCPPYPPVVDVPVVIPDFPATSKAIAIGIVDDPVGPNWIGYDDKTHSWEAPNAQTKTVLWQYLQPSQETAAQALGLALGLPVSVYLDRPVWNVPEPAGSLPVAQAYIQPGESLPAYEQRLSLSLTALAGRPCGLCVRAFTGNGQLTEQQVLDAMAVTWDLAAKASVVVLWFFADLRADGLPAHPCFRVAIDRQKAASADWRAFPVRPEPPHPPEPPIMPLIPEPELTALATSLGHSYDVLYAPDGNGYGMVREVWGVLRTQYNMDGDRTLLLSLARENALRIAAGTQSEMADVIKTAVRLQRRT